MNISDLQTIDFILKKSVSRKAPYEESNLKLLLKCDDLLLYGDLVRLDGDYVYEQTFDPYSRRIEKELIGTSLQSSETKQIDAFKATIQPFKNDLVKEFFMFISYEYNLELLNSYLISLVGNLDGDNDLPSYLYNATFLNIPKLINIPSVNLDSFASVQLVSIFEAPKIRCIFQ